MEILYLSVQEHLWCDFASNPIIIVMKTLNTQRNVARRFEDEIANVGAHPRDKQVPRLEKDAYIDHAPVNPSPLADENLRNTLLKMAQSNTTQAQPAMNQA